MSSSRLQRRIPTARPLGRARLPGMRLTFNKPSHDGSGKANLVAAPGGIGWGVLFEVAGSDWSELDRWEPKYVRRPCEVFDDAGRMIGAELYLYEDGSADLEPFDWYLRHLIEGAREHALPEDFIAALLRVRCRRG